LHGFRRQVSVGIQPAALADRLFEVLGPDKFLVLDDPYLEAKTIRAEVYRGESMF
jgi:hypothetical protein